MIDAASFNTTWRQVAKRFRSEIDTTKGTQNGQSLMEFKYDLCLGIDNYYRHSTHAGAQSDKMKNDPSLGVKHWIDFTSVIGRHVPVLSGVMKAEGSTKLFLQHINDYGIYQWFNCAVCNVGTNQGAISAALARIAKFVYAVEPLPEAFRNTKLTLSAEVEEVQQKVTIFNEELVFLRSAARGKLKARALFFNCPIFRGHGDLSSLAGDDFEVPKETLLMLPQLLDMHLGRAYFLAANAFTKEGEERLWTVNKLRNFLEKEMPGWGYYELIPRAPINSHGEYVVVEIFPLPSIQEQTTHQPQSWWSSWAC